MVGRNPSGTLGAWGARLWARRLVILGSVLVGLLAGLLASQLMPQKYAATAVVNVAPLTVNQFGSSQSTQVVNMESERSAVTSASVVERAARSVQQDDPEALADSLSVVVPSQSLILKVTSTTREPQQAARWANAVAQAYLVDRTVFADEAATRIIERLQAELDARLATRAAQPPADRALADQDIAALRERISTLTTVGLNPGRVITPAVPPTESASLPFAAMVVGGQALGLLVGILIAVLGDRFGTRARSGARLAWATGWPVHEVRPDPVAPAVGAVERALAMRPTDGPGRYLILDLTGRGCPELLAELTLQLRDLAPGSESGPESGNASGPESGNASGPEFRREFGTAAPEIIDETGARRPTAAAARARSGDVVLVAVADDTALGLIDDVDEVLAARGARVAAALFLRRPRGPVASRRSGRPSPSADPIKPGDPMSPAAQDHHQRPDDSAWVAPGRRRLRVRHRPDERTGAPR